MKKLMIGAGLAALMTAPAFAQQPPPGGSPAAQTTVTRADVQARIQQRFATIDANRDGAITQAEFDAHRAKNAAERKAKRAERRGAVFAQLDTNGDGRLSREEFQAARQKAGKERRGGHRFGMRGRGKGDVNWFARFDANKDGKVTLAELSSKPLAMFDRADANKDGRVTPDERKAARESMRAEWKAKRG